MAAKITFSLGLSRFIFYTSVGLIVTNEHGDELQVPKGLVTLLDSNYLRSHLNWASAIRIARIRTNQETPALIISCHEEITDAKGRAGHCGIGYLMAFADIQKKYQFDFLVDEFF